jgi:arylsulfatase A
MRWVLGLALLLPAQAEERPNVLLIIADDMGWGDIRSHGNDRIDTPNLDRLAAEGARFDRFFVSPVCAPTRAALLTGRWPLRTGVHGVTRGYETMRAGEVTIAEVLRDAGYATGAFGKWHNGAHYPNHPNGQGFEEFFGFCGGHWNNYFDTTLERNREPVRTKGFITDVLADAAIAFIEKHRARPFFCYVPFNAPHSPFQVPDRHFDRHKARGLDDRTASVYGMVENVDENVGRLLAKLAELKIAGKTLVVFLTDNGPNTDRFNGGMKGRKGSVDEGGVRVPLFMRWPGKIAPGIEVAEPTAHIDLFPTLLALAGIPAPRAVRFDGRSLLKLVLRQGAGWRDRNLFREHNNRGAVRTGRWLWVSAGKGAQLYDMLEDPEQKKDVAGQNADVAAELKEAYERWHAEVTRDLVDRPPVPVGHAEAPVVEMPAPEAYLEGGLHWKGKAGFANDWIAGWTDTKDAPAWELDVAREGRFAVTLLYTCPEKDAGAKVRVEAAGAVTETGGVRAHDPAPLPSPDRVPRGEVFEKEWAALELGALALPNGRARLAVRALEKPGAQVMELKALRLRRVP